MHGDVVKRLYARARRLKPETLIFLLFAVNGLFIGVSLGPWWLALVTGLLNMCLLIALRLSLSDYLLTRFLGVDAIVPQGREPRILVVVPDDHGKTTVMPQQSEQVH